MHLEDERNDSQTSFPVSGWDDCVGGGCNFIDKDHGRRSRLGRKLGLAVDMQHLRHPGGSSIPLLIV